MEREPLPTPTLPEPTPAILQEIMEDLAPLRHKRRRALLGSGGLLALLALGVPLARRGALDPSTLLSPLIWILLSLPLFAFALGARFHAARALWMWLGGLLLCGLVALVGTIDGFSAEGLLHWACLLAGLLSAGGFFIVALVLGRGAFRRHAPVGLLLGLAVGLLALIPTHLTCPIHAAGHLMLWHATIPVFSGVLFGAAWGLGRR